MVDGKTAGETSLIIWDDRGGRQFFNVTVRASTAALDNNMEAVRRELSHGASRTAAEGDLGKWRYLFARHGEGPAEFYAC